MYRPQFVSHSSIDGHLGCFHFLATVNHPTLNMDGQISLRVPVFTSFGCIHTQSNFLLLKIPSTLSQSYVVYNRNPAQAERKTTVSAKAARTPGGSHRACEPDVDPCSWDTPPGLTPPGTHLQGLSHLLGHTSGGSHTSWDTPPGAHTAADTGHDLSSNMRHNLVLGT